MRTSIRTALATAVTVSLTGGLLGLTTGTVTAAVPAKAPKPAQAYDFNGDGNRDYAASAGHWVDVTYGTRSGPGTRTFRFDQTSPGIPGDGPALEEDAFGRTMASADFNGDGYADLAVSDPEETIVDEADLDGMVIIVWGSKSGLGSKASTIESTAPYLRNQSFGVDLAAGDFNGDGRPDLAISDRTSVHVHRGGFTPANTTGRVESFTTPDDIALPFPMLAAGNVTKDKTTDLYAIGESYMTNRPTMAVWFLKGGSTIKPAKPKLYPRSKTDYFTTDAVVADFDKDGYGDLVYNDKLYKELAGAVHVLRGGKNGPTTSRRITQDTPGVATTATAYDYFGGSLSAGDTNRDGYADLAIGTHEPLGTLRRAGGAHVLYGGKKGLTGSGSEWFTRDTKGIPGKAKEGALFGGNTRLDDFDRDGDADLLLSGDSVKDRRGGTLLNGGRSGITTAKVREGSLRATYEQ
ncbi:FG-GAP and VCBS repeat-containing protein [Streptomyces jumonjinensis]|uniref:FG-GAP and VCBS repeat-containing protein n=1 Tax=Streptomyces jumonjinensis TaxID=1945 RepID=UPI003792A02F